MGMGASCKKNASKATKNSQNKDESESCDEIDDETDTKCPLEEAISSQHDQPKKLRPARGERQATLAAAVKQTNNKNKRLGADGVGRFGDDDEHSNDETDLSQQSQNEEQLTPSRRQHRILRERRALDDGLVQLQQVEKFSLSVIDEDGIAQEESNNNNNVAADLDKKKKTRRAVKQKDTLASDDDNDTKNDDGDTTSGDVSDSQTSKSAVNKRTRRK